MPSGLGDHAASGEMPIELFGGQVRVSSGAPESSNCPPGSSEMAPLAVRVIEADQVAPSSMPSQPRWPRMPSKSARIPRSPP